MRGASCAGLVLAALLFAAAASAQNGTDIEFQRQVRRLEIHGNTAYSDGKLKGLLRTRGHTWKPWRKSPFRPDFIRVDRITLQSFYRRHGYLDALVDSVRVVPSPDSPSSVDIGFYVTEGSLHRVEAVRIEGAGPIPELELRRLLAERPGGPLDIPQIELDRQAIEDRYGDLGYVTAQVRDSLEIVGTRVRVLHQVRPGDVVRLRGIAVEGNKQTRPKLVTRSFLIRRGDVLSRAKLLQSQQRVYDTGLYKDVQFSRGEIDSATHLTDLTVSVVEQKMSWIDAGLGYGTEDHARITGEWGNRNIGQEGIRLAATGKVGIRFATNPFLARFGDRRVDLGLSQPWIFGWRTQGRLGGYYEHVPQIREGTDFALRAYGATFSLRRDLARYTYGSLGLEYRHVISDSVSLTTSYGSGQTTYSTRRVVLSAERDTRRELFDPKQGADVVGEVQIAGGALQGSSNFQKFSGSATAYVNAWRRATLALRARSGYVLPIGDAPRVTASKLDLVPVDDRFRTGGATSVRGYFEDEIGYRNGVKPRRGGAILILANAELRFPIVWIVSGAAFVDGGNVWERAEDITLGRLFTIAGDGAGYSDMRYTFGGGIRFGTPVGPVRFDYGWKLRGARPDEPDLSSRRGTFHFSLGQAF